MNYKSYKQWSSMADDLLLKQIGSFVKHHRLEQNRSQEQVARDAGLGRSTLSLLERGESVKLMSLLQVLRVLDLLYVMDTFHVEDEIGPVEYAKMQKKKRKHAWSVLEDSGVDELEW